MKTLSLYSRAGCHLCEEFIEALMPMLRGRAEIEVIDIDVHTERRESYQLRIPVLADGDDVICEAFVDGAAVRACLDKAGD